MLKATTSLDDDARVDPSLAQIQSSLQIVMQANKQVRVHEEVLRAAGVRLDRAGVALLYKLRLAGDIACRVTSLAALLGVDAPTVTRKVQQLERLGYVSREPDPEDRRATLIRLTLTGHETLERVLIAHRERLARLLQGWSEDDVERFSTLLERFAISLRHETEASDGE